MENFAQIILAFHEIHGKGYSHGYISARNFLFKKFGLYCQVVKIA